MKIYNTLTRTKEEFKTLEPGKVKMYVCGPTVYGLIHIGNARPYVVFDTVRRYLTYKGYDVTYIQNYTDVDDKIIKRANDENTTPAQIAQKYIEEVEKDAAGLNVLPATHNPRVTEEIADITDMIQTLIRKGFAYEKNGSVYYHTDSFEEYGKLSKRDFEQQEAGVRIEIDLEKESPTDFILWKPKKEGEIFWPSPWGDGRPGWHIECSVMAKKYLGETIDIHAGGEDLIFPHHENEIAQSEAANEKPFATYWMHVRFINIDNEKMSKSKGNFFTLRDIAQEFDYDVIRFFILTSHYRSPINFSGDLLQAAGTSLERIKTCISNLRFAIDNTQNSDMTEEETAILVQGDVYKQDFIQNMDDDFNTADAISAIFELVRFANKNSNEQSSKQFLKKLSENILFLCDILGISVESKKNVGNEAVEKLILDRANAKKNKDFKLADEIRDKLTAMGVIIEDTRQGVRWYWDK